MTSGDFIENGGYLPSGARYNNPSQSPLGASSKLKTILLIVLSDNHQMPPAQKKAIQEALDKWKAKLPPRETTDKA